MSISFFSSNFYKFFSQFFSPLFVCSADIIYYVCLAVNSFFENFLFFWEIVCKTDKIML
nr:MAG TPA: hypothetical protein [Caudoviricetes sp.]